MKLRSIVFPIASLFAWQLPGAEEPKHVDVCDLFMDMAVWDGRMVQLEAVLIPPGPESGYGIDGSNCAAKIEIDGVRFFNYLQMSNATRGRQNLHKVDFLTIESPRLVDILQGFDKNVHIIRATVIGLFETRIPLSKLVVYPGGDRLRPQRFGFGGDDTPAQIIIKEIRNPRIEPK